MAKDPFQGQQAEKDEEIRLATEAEAKAKRDADEAFRLAEQRRKEEAARLKQGEREAEQARVEASRTAKSAERTAGRADRALETAERQEGAAVAKETRVEMAKPADYGRVRGEYGGLGTLTRKWTFANLDRATIDLRALRPFIPMDGLERAVRAFIDAGGRELRGVDIFEDDKTRVV